MSQMINLKRNSPPIMKTGKRICFQYNFLSILVIPCVVRFAALRTSPWQALLAGREGRVTSTPVFPEKALTITHT